MFDTIQTYKREASLQRFLCKLKHNNIFNENKYDKLYPPSSASVGIYDTTKIHKFSSSDSFSKINSIVSSKSSFNYNLARFLCDLFSPWAPNDHLWKGTFSFVSKIKYANLSRTFLVSYDVTSLFILIFLFKKPLI